MINNMFVMHGLQGYSIFGKELNMTNHMKGCKCLPACTDIQYYHESVEFFRNWTTGSTPGVL